MSEDEADFADLFPSLVPRVLQTSVWESGDVPSVEFEFTPEPILDSVALEDIESQRNALLHKFPEAHRGYLEQVLGSSRHHVWAMLKEKVDGRIDDLIHRFLRQQGRVTSHQRSEVKGHGVDWSGFSDTGLIFHRVSNRHAGGYVYELRLDDFDQNRGSRDALSGKDRRSLFTLHQNRCNALGCGSGADLQADHRVGVVIAGTSTGLLDAFQPLCRPCNLNKRVACEQCGLGAEDCTTCSWAYPESHTHTAGEPGSRAIFRLTPGSYPRAQALLKEHGLLV